MGGGETKEIMVRQHNELDRNVQWRSTHDIERPEEMEGDFVVLPLEWCPYVRQEHGISKQ